MAEREVTAADPFELPDWVGTEEVVWAAGSSIGSHLVTGTLRAGDEPFECDVMACDLAHPIPVLTDKWRTAAHQAWSLGEVLLIYYGRRLTLAVPGSAVDVEAALEAVRRLARAVGAPPERFSVTLRL